MPERRYDLVAFDVDGTLVRGPRGLIVWELLNERFAGTAELNRERYARFRAGEISYADWVALDIGGWRDAGATRDDLVAAMADLCVVGGAVETVARLREAGVRTVVISGTLDLVLRTLLPDAGFDEVYTNHIGFDEGGAITHWKATPFDMRGKAQLLRAIALREGLPLGRCAFVGDSGNDVWIAEAAGLSIAFNPSSEELSAVADHVIESEDLRDLLPYLLDAPARSSKNA